MMLRLRDIRKEAEMETVRIIDAMNRQIPPDDYEGKKEYYRLMSDIITCHSATKARRMTDGLYRRMCRKILMKRIFERK